MNKSSRPPLFNPLLHPPPQRGGGKRFQRGGSAYILLLALLFFFGLSHTADAQSLNKIRIASKGSGEPLVAYTIPQRLGFYREEGLDPEVIVTRGTVTTQVVVSGAVDYSNGGSIPAILAGAMPPFPKPSSARPASLFSSCPQS